MLESLDQEVNMNDDLPPPSYHNNQSTVSSVSDTSYPSSKICSHCDTQIILAIFFLILAVFFALYGSIMYGISVSKYKKNKNNHPEYETFKVSTGLSVIHWLFFAVAIISMTICICLSYKQTYILYIAPLAFFGIFWIAYGVTAGTSEIFKASGKLQNEAYFIDYSKSLKKAIPYIEFEATANSYDTEFTNNGNCYLSGIRIYASAWTDNTPKFNLTNQSEISLIHTQVDLEILDPEFVENAKKEILNNLMNSCHYVSGDICEDWRVTSSNGVEGMKNLVFVTLTGEVPSKFSTSNRVLKGMFWAGTPYAFDLAASSSYSTYRVVKKNVILTGSIDPDKIRKNCRS